MFVQSESGWENYMINFNSVEPVDLQNSLTKFPSKIPLRNSPTKFPYKIPQQNSLTKSTSEIPLQNF